MNDVLIAVGISGSLRKTSTNSGLLRAAQEVAPADLKIEIADIMDIPFYNADVAAQGKPQAVKRIVARIAAADALVLACPEYNYSIAPALKNAIDWVSREPGNAALAGKPVAILGAGGRMGSSRAQYHLRQSCVFLDLHPLNKPEVFAHASGGSFSEAGDLVDPKIRQLVADQMQALVKWTRRLKLD
ncbi:MAG: NAD(P)H-dependent oxidoreductase [Gammaproteobacteria bacterium]